MYLQQKIGIRFLYITRYITHTNMYDNPLGFGSISWQ